MSSFTLPNGIFVHDGTNTVNNLDLEQFISITSLFPQYIPLIQSRQLDKKHVDVLANLDAASLPPIKVIHVSKDGEQAYCVIDGYHRLEAALKRNDQDIKAITVSYDRPDDIIVDYFECNLKHGMTANKTTRTAYAILIHQLNPDMGINSIARHVGINKSTVSRAVRKHKESTNKETVEVNAANQVLKTMNKLINQLVDNYGDDINIVGEQFMQDFCIFFDNKDDKYVKARDILFAFLDVSKSIAHEIE